MCLFDQILSVMQQVFDTLFHFAKATVSPNTLSDKRDLCCRQNILPQICLQFMPSQELILFCCHFVLFIHYLWKQKSY